ncbi:MAG: hypothetical protein GEV28_23055 [Actinophytocola sp.]|nr:hypothetical protein [Actinophytocola sp.]
MPAATVASNTLCGLESPSLLPSETYPRQVDGMNCIAPTARSQRASPSSRPPSVSRIAAKPPPLRTGPRMLGVVLPAPSTRPPRAWLDSIRPMLASSDQWRWQLGCSAARIEAALRYASYIGPGIIVGPVGRSPGSLSWRSRSMLSALARTSSPILSSSPTSPFALTESGSVRPYRPPPTPPAACAAEAAWIGSPATAAATSNIVPVAAAALRRRRFARRSSLPVDLLLSAALTCTESLH